MNTSNLSLLSLDPSHISCTGGRTVLTCRNCAGNAPRIIGSKCSGCEGRGFNIFICAHCNPNAAASSIRAGPTSSSVRASNAVTASTTPGSSTASSPASLSRSPSMSYSDPRAPRSWKRNDASGRGRIEANTPRNL